MTHRELSPEIRPGSNAAILQGCTCPVFDNAHGLGAYGDGAKYGWWMDENCLVHGEVMQKVKGELYQDKILLIGKASVELRGKLGEGWSRHAFD